MRVYCNTTKGLYQLYCRLLDTDTSMFSLQRTLSGERRMAIKMTGMAVVGLEGAVTTRYRAVGTEREGGPWTSTGRAHREGWGRTLTPNQKNSCNCIGYQESMFRHVVDCAQ